MGKVRNALREIRRDPGNALLDFTRGGLMGATTDMLGYIPDAVADAMRPFGYNVPREQVIGGSDWLASKFTSPTGAPAETAGRFLTGMVTPGPNELLQAAGFVKKAPPVNELITYHSSPHRINNVSPEHPAGRFDMSKIGTGEGAQAYGHGIYLSEDGVMNRNHYFNKFNQSNSWRVGDEVFTPNPHAMEYTWQNRVAMALREADGDIDKAIAAIKKTVPEGYQGGSAIEGAMGYLHRMKRLGKTPEKATASFYTVDLPDEHIAKMLDWDAPLSQQPESVRKALANYAAADDANITGGEFYRKLVQEMGAEPEEISQALNAAGVPGIRYLDGNSRVTSFGPRDSGTRNFVIFDPDYAKILKRE